LKEISVEPNIFAKEMTGLMANLTYSYTVRAVNRAGSGDESEEIMFNTKSECGVTQYYYNNDVMSHDQNPNRQWSY